MSEKYLDEWEEFGASVKPKLYIRDADGRLWHVREHVAVRIKNLKLWMIDTPSRTIAQLDDITVTYLGHNYVKGMGRTLYPIFELRPGMCGYPEIQYSFGHSIYDSSMIDFADPKDREFPMISYGNICKARHVLLHIKASLGSLSVGFPVSSEKSDWQSLATQEDAAVMIAVSGALHKYGFRCVQIDEEHREYNDHCYFKDNQFWMHFLWSPIGCEGCSSWPKVPMGLLISLQENLDRDLNHPLYGVLDKGVTVEVLLDLAERRKLIDEDKDES